MYAFITNRKTIVAHTTEQQIAELAARHEADAEGSVMAVTKTEHIAEGRQHHVKFTLADGSTQVFASHGTR